MDLSEVIQERIEEHIHEAMYDMDHGHTASVLGDLIDKAVKKQITPLIAAYIKKNKTALVEQLVLKKLS